MLGPGIVYELLLSVVNGLGMSHGSGRDPYSVHIPEYNQQIMTHCLMVFKGPNFTVWRVGDPVLMSVSNRPRRWSPREFFDVGCTVDPDPKVDFRPDPVLDEWDHNHLKSRTPKKLTPESKNVRQLTSTRSRGTVYPKRWYCEAVSIVPTQTMTHWIDVFTMRKKRHKTANLRSMIQTGCEFPSPNMFSYL